MCILPITLIVQLFVLYIVIVKHATSFPYGDGNESESITDTGLYNASDHIVILNATNLNSTICGSKNAWAVEFYSSWCGHCRRFASVWKSVARDTKAWKDIIDVAAIDCANGDNNDLCRKYEIMFYPMIRYFSPHTKPGGIGIQVQQAKTADTMRNYIVEQLQKDQQAGIGKNWPNIAPYRSSKSEDIWKGVSPSVVYKFILFEETDSYLGSEIILDFHNETQILIRRITSDNQMLCMNYQVTDFPNLFVIDNNEVRKNLKIITPTRSGVMRVIKNFMKSQGMTVDVPDIHANDIIDESDKSKNDQSLNSVKIIDGDLDQTDLETAIRYSLEHEIPLQKIIDDQLLSALKKYLEVLYQYLPLKSGNSEYFKALRETLDDSDSITGEEFYQLVTSKEKDMAPVYSTDQQWVRCKGSKSRLRGYPCGIWTLFHTMTANYAAADPEDTSDPIRILSTMFGYIKYFFGCADCSDHFVTMAGKLKLFSVKSADEAVLWLWQAHNEVNERLSGDITEDPEFPKIQYPAEVHCSECRDSDEEWNLPQVLKYLKKKYTYPRIENDNASEPHFMKLSRNELPMNKNMTHQQKTSWDFTLFDISICVLLYVTSAIILTLVCIKFLVKRTSKKKMQVHSLFLRV